MTAIYRERTLVLGYVLDTSFNSYIRCLLQTKLHDSLESYIFLMKIGHSSLQRCGDVLRLL